MLMKSFTRICGLLMAPLIGADVLVGGGGATAPLPGAPTDDSCRSPGKGMPHFDPVVLAALYGDGYITRSQYDRVKAGTLSIEDLEITAVQLQRLRCQDGGASVLPYDPHNDPDLKPKISNVPAGTTVEFTTGHAPTDRVHKLTIDTGNAAIAAAAIVATVTFAEEYVDPASGKPIAPAVYVSPTSAEGTWRVQNVTSKSYDLITDSGVGGNEIFEASVLIEPARRI
jgi:hypothetical protein